MTALREILSAGSAWLPFAVALLATAAVITVARRWLIVRPVVLIGAGPFLRELVMLLLTGAGLALLVLTLPIGDSARGQILALIGLLLTAAITLSSTTFIGNAMAGLMLRAVHNFRAGDFLKVGEHFGRVSEQGFLHTEIQTEDRDLTTLPNLYLVTTPVTVIRSSGTIISATVSLGYDVARHRVETQLKVAAERAELSDPFVQILDLGDFSVTYRLGGFLEDVKQLISARSRLRAMMLDALHEDRIEIVSPTFMNQRQLAAERHFIPPATPAPEATDALLAIPESLMFDKAEQAESIVQARTQLTQVADEIAATRKERDGAPADRTVRLDARLEVLEAQRVRFAEQAERMLAEAERAKSRS